MPSLADTAALVRGGGLSAAESWAWHRHRLAERESAYDPRVALRIRRGEAISGADYIDLVGERRRWIARTEAALVGIDALLSPTVPIVAPRLQPLVDSDDAFFAANAMLLRNPSLINLLDGCALSLPCHREGDWPVGLMVWGPALADDRVLAVSLAIEQALRGRHLVRIAVVGAGIVGVATAYELACDGHQVTVFERRASVAVEASFANAGVVAPGYVAPWAAPGMLRKVLGQIGRRDAAVRLATLPGPALAGWLWRWWRACAAPRHLVHRNAMLALATASQARTREVAASLAIEHEHASGLLVLLRSERELVRARAGLGWMTEHGIAFHLVDAEGCRRIEPALDEATPLRAGIYQPGADVGNCRQFAIGLKAELQRRGVDFRFGQCRAAPDARPTRGDRRQCGAGRRHRFGARQAAGAAQRALRRRDCLRRHRELHAAATARPETAAGAGVRLLDHAAGAQVRDLP